LELRSKILASIPHLGGTAVIIETTGNGYGPFYDEWMQEEREPGSTGFENMFFGWPEHPEYRLEA
jgi:hypothetical protein